MNNIKQPIFGNWYIEEEIGSGAFGTVYKIMREDFGKRYYSALKVIHIPQDKNESKSLIKELGDKKSVSDYYSNFVQDFAKEIEVMAQLKGNSNIVSFEDHSFIPDEDGIGWTILIRMELLIPFVDYMVDNNITTEDVIRLGIELCTALEICEEKHIIHRDIKPDNIFLSENGRFELGDFGIARELEKTTGGLSKKGTYSYMAPEVYKGEPYNNTVDIYSLGIVMYKLLNHNRAPFMPDYPNPIKYSDREEALRKRMSGDAVSPIKDIPTELSDIVCKACAFNPKDRYASASDMKVALLEYCNGIVTTKKSDVNASESIDYDDEKTSSPFSSDVSTNRIDSKKIADDFAEDEKTSGMFSESNITESEEIDDNEDEKTASCFGDHIISSDENEPENDSCVADEDETVSPFSHKEVKNSDKKSSVLDNVENLVDVAMKSERVSKLVDEAKKIATSDKAKNVTEKIKKVPKDSIWSKVNSIIFPIVAAAVMISSSIYYICDSVYYGFLDATIMADILHYALPIVQSVIVVILSSMAFWNMKVAKKIIFQILLSIASLGLSFEMNSGVYIISIIFATVALICFISSSFIKKNGVKLTFNIIAIITMLLSAYPVWFYILDYLLYGII